MKRLIIFLIRKHLGLKKYEKFQFTNQKTDNVYYFTNSHVMKVDDYGHISQSNVSLNWLLNDECEIKCLDGHEYPWIHLMEEK